MTPPTIAPLRWADEMPLVSVDDYGQMFQRKSTAVPVLPDLVSVDHGRLLGEPDDIEEIKKFHFRDRVMVSGKAVVVPGAELFGVGLIKKDDSIVALPSVLPGYFKNAVLSTDYSKSFWTEKLVEANLGCVYSDMPLGVVVHPNIVYGHVLLEMLSKMLLARHLIDSGVQMKIACPRKIASYAVAFVKSAFREEEIFWYEHHNTSVTAPHFVLLPMLHDDYRFHPYINSVSSLFISLLSREASLAPPVCSGFEHYTNGLLFLSRKGHRTAKQGIANESEVEAMLAAKGFLIFSPEAHDLKTQMQVFGKTRLVVSDYNSSLHNTLFMPFNCSVISLNWFNYYQHYLCAARRQDLHFIKPADGRFRNWLLRGTEDAWYPVDVSKLSTAVEHVLARDVRLT